MMSDNEKIVRRIDSLAKSKGTSIAEIERSVGFGNGKIGIAGFLIFQPRYLLADLGFIQHIISPLCPLDLLHAAADRFAGLVVVRVAHHILQLRMHMLAGVCAAVAAHCVAAAPTV